MEKLEQIKVLRTLNHLHIKGDPLILKLQRNDNKTETPKLKYLLLYLTLKSFNRLAAAG